MCTAYWCETLLSGTDPNWSSRSAVSGQQMAKQIVITQHDVE